MANYYSEQAYLSKTIADIKIAKDYATRLADSSVLDSIKTEATVLVSALEALNCAISNKREQDSDYSIFRIYEPERSEKLYRSSFIYGIICNVNSTLERAIRLNKPNSTESEQLSNKLIKKDINEALFAVNAALKDQDGHETNDQTPYQSRWDAPRTIHSGDTFFDELEKDIINAERVASESVNKASRMRILDHAHNVKIFRELIEDELERLDEAISDASSEQGENA